MLRHLNKDAYNEESVVAIPLHEKTIDMHCVIQRLLGHTQQPGDMTARLFHIDIAHEVLFHFSPEHIHSREVNFYLGSEICKNVR